MTSIAPAELGARACKAIAQAKEYAWGWAKLAQFLSDNSDFAETADTHPGSVLAYLLPDEDPLSRMADFARRGIAAGARVEKEYDDDYGKVKLHFGPVYVQVYTNRGEVCERVVVGKRRVVEKVQDPEALAAVPMVERTRVEDVVEWQCRPLLAGSDEAAQVSA